MLRLAILALLALPLSSRSPDRSESTVVLLVRHAERSPGTGDVPLSPAGRERADDLARIGQEAGVQAIVTTQFARTRNTAHPLASALAITPEVVATKSDLAAHIREVADAVKRHSGQVVLVVGHSNTIPSIVAALGGTRYPDLCDSEYDALFTMIIDPDGKVSTVRSRYGAPSPADAACEPMRPEAGAPALRAVFSSGADPETGPAPAPDAGPA